MSWCFKTEEQSKLYSRYRFDYPKALCNRVLGYMGDEFLEDGCKLGLAVDVGCGTGQNTWPLAKLFENVVGVDVSQSQLSEARKAWRRTNYTNIIFKQAEAHKMDFLEDGSVDLITVAIALHWFDRKKFFRECLRVLRSSGVLAAFAYDTEIQDFEGVNIVQEVFLVIITY